jgi:uncharacterized protein involved in exopolysaccharide biosynthesis
MSEINVYQSSGDEVDLMEIFYVLWSEKWLGLGITAFATAVSILVALSISDVYRAETTLVPAETRQSASPLAAQLGGAASILGINIGGGESSRVSKAIAVLQSREFIGEFLKKHNAVVPLFAGQWDSEKGTSTFNSEIFDDQTQQWKNPALVPTELQAYRAFSNILQITQDMESGIIKVSIEWKDPVLAQYWVNSIIGDLNRKVKEADLTEATNAIEFLRRQLESTSLIEMQRVFYGLIESQIRVSMLADVREEYAFQVIDVAVVPDEASYPNRPLIVLMGVFVGIILSVLAILAKWLRFRKV